MTSHWPHIPKLFPAAPNEREREQTGENGANFKPDTSLLILDAQLLSERARQLAGIAPYPDLEE